MSEQFDYKFRAVNEDEFVCDLSTTFEEGLMSAFLLKIGKKSKKDMPDIDGVQKIVLPDESFGSIRGLLSKTLNDVRKDVGSDGVTIVSWKIHRIELSKLVTGSWIVLITVKGYYDKS